MADAENQPNAGDGPEGRHRSGDGHGFAHRHQPSSIEALGHQRAVPDEEKMPRDLLGTDGAGPDLPSLRGGRKRGDVEARLAFVRGQYREEEVPPVGQELRPPEGRLLPRFVRGGEELRLPPASGIE